MLTALFPQYLSVCFWSAWNWICFSKKHVKAKWSYPWGVHPVYKSNRYLGLSVWRLYAICYVITKTNNVTNSATRGRGGAWRAEWHLNYSAECTQNDDVISFNYCARRNSTRYVCDSPETCYATFRDDSIRNAIQLENQIWSHSCFFVHKRNLFWKRKESVINYTKRSLPFLKACFDYTILLCKFIYGIDDN